MYEHIPKDERKKLDSKAKKCVLLVRWPKRAIAQKKLTLKEKSHHAKKSNTANKKSYKAT